MQRVRNNKKILEYFAACSSKDQKNILKFVNSDAIKTILEIIINILKGNLKIDENLKNKLKKYKSILYKLNCPKKSLKQKRKVLIQKGGFLNFLIPAVLGAILNKITRS